MSMYSPPAQGLTTEEAFAKLVQELSEVLDNYKHSRAKIWSEIIKASFSTRSQHTCASWCSFLVLIIESLVILSLAIANYNTTWRTLFPEAVIMLLLAVFNGSLMVWENYKRLNELPVKLEKMIDKLKGMITTWEDSNYPDLYLPFSPCISTQWCYRDGRLVNLPWAFLVPNDLIILIPGQKVIAKCQLFNNPDCILSPGTIFVPVDKDTSSDPESEPLQLSEDEIPKLHVPMESNFALVLETPYKQTVQLSFDSFLKRPKTFYIKERHRVVNGLIECIVLPLAFMIFVALCIVRMFYLPHWLGIRVAPWADLLLLQPLVNTFSLIPVALPFLYVFLHCVGNAKIHTLYSVLKNSRNMKVDVEDKESVPLTYYHVDLSLRSIYREVWEFFKGREETLHRSQKLLHILATVTALCCVDKKGVLSWPNPTADKVFFLKTNVNSVTKKREVSTEILDVTHDNRNAFELHFDDKTWESHLSSLKPIGLNILLNCCNYKTRATYSSFHSHITNELQTRANDLVVPVVARRCLCELARIIGFTEKATTVFRLEQELCSYRHIESDEICRDKLTRAKIKFPFPHMMSVVIKEKIYQTLQLMSQGTGDMILDVCDDFWDGFDLRPLNNEERKLILDFYQRSSLTSTCAAFAYKPLQAKVSHHLASLYMELPPSKGTRYLPYYALTNGTPHSLAKDGSISTDCIYNMAEKRKSSEREVTDLDGCFEVQTNQIFLGMVAMQYEACMDMVQLIEQLDQACIRFVHFSKENELRSRVFSEKMGLESGWNCHISLRPLTEEEKLEEEREEREQALFNQRLSDQPDSVHFYCTSEVDLKKQHHQTSRRPTLNEIINGSKRPSLNDSGDNEDCKYLPRCSASVPEMVMLSRNRETTSSEPEETQRLLDTHDRDFDGNYTDIDTVSTKQVLFQQLSGSESSLFIPVLSSEPLKIEDKNQSEVPEVPCAIKEKGSVIRFADSVDDPSESDNNHHHAGAAGSLRVTDSFNRQRNLTPTESYNDAYEMAEHKTPLGYDMSNRAKLPRGIEEVRPHLEHVDNVPLLVSLFTDCTAENSREMIKIMQDYGEVILLVGSVSNHENPGLFLQADASVGLEPLYPQACQKQENCVPPNPGKASPTEVSMLLTSLPCSLALKRSDPISFYHLIAHSRHYMNNCIRNSIQFWLCCQVSLTLLGLIALIMLIPPLFTIADTMWLSCFVIPILSLTLCFARMDRVDPETMELASFKNQVTLDRSIFSYVLYYYGLKFVLSLLNLAIMAAFNLRWICDIHLKNVNNTCSWVYPVVLSVEPLIDKSVPQLPGAIKCISSWACGDNAPKLLFVQQYTLFFLVLYYICISGSFLHRTKHIWVENPFRNKIWVFMSLGILCIQFFYGMIRLGGTFAFDLVLGVSYGWAIAWAPLVLVFNEMLRRQEIKMNIRFQKRARLDYGTKLGMNSPF